LLITEQKVVLHLFYKTPLHIEKLQVTPETSI